MPKLQGLADVQSRVADGFVAAGQVSVRDLLRPTETLGDVLAGELHV